MNSQTATSATTKATTSPISRIVRFFESSATWRGAATIYSSVYPVAEAIVGAARKNENSPSFFLESPVNMPPTIVVMDRDTSGIRATH